MKLMNFLTFGGLAPIFGMGFIGQVLGAIGSIIGGSQAASGAEESARIQADAAREAAAARERLGRESIAEQRRQFNLIRELNEPFRLRNLQAFDAQRDLLGLGGMGLPSSPLEESGPSETDLPDRGPPGGTVQGGQETNPFGGTPPQGGTPGMGGATGPEPNDMMGAARNRRGQEIFRENQIRQLGDPRNVLQMLLRLKQRFPDNPNIDAGINRLQELIGDRKDFPSSMGPGNPNRFFELGQ